MFVLFQEFVSYSPHERDFPHQGLHGRVNIFAFVISFEYQSDSSVARGGSNHIGYRCPQFVHDVDAILSSFASV